MKQPFRVVCRVLLCVASVILPQHAGAQVMKAVPSPRYFDLSLVRYQAGHFERALADFNDDLRGAVKIGSPDGQVLPWVDSLCYWVMIGECHYQMARYEEAMTAFNQAVQVYIANFDWLLKVGYTGNPIPAARTPHPWGQSTRRGSVGNFRNCSFKIRQDSLNLIGLGRHGVGVMQQATMTTIYADEIVARMGLLIRRRAEILGPLSKYDPLTKELSEVLGGRPCLPNHFTGTWIDVLYGLSLSALGDDPMAAESLQRGLLMQASFDHQLTPVALFELGNIALRAGKLDEALGYYLECTYSSYFARDTVLLSEAFQSMANVQKLVDKTKPVPAIHAAATFFSTQREVSPMILAALNHEVAEDFLTSGNIEAAAKHCALAAAAMNRREIFDTVYGARNHYLTAAIAYATGYAAYKSGKPLAPQMTIADKHLETALGFMRRGSLRFYQLAVLESFFKQGRISARGPITIRLADELYDLMLRESNAADWALQPMDCLTMLAFAPPGAYQRWFYVAIQRGDNEKAFNISEQARRARFYAALPLGPRLLSLRLLLEGRQEDMTPAMILQRQSLSLDLGEFTKLSDQAKDIKRKLQSIPLVPKEPAQRERQQKLLADLDAVSLAQEALLRPIALSRTQSPNAFPPMRTYEDLRQELPEQTTMLVFFEALGEYHGFMLDRRNLRRWVVSQGTREATLHELMTAYLEGMGNRDANRSVPIKDIAAQDGKWKAAGEKLLTRLLGNRQQQVNFTELVIVPTGPLWYVPFESLSVNVNGTLKPLLAAGADPLTIRYAPMASLGVPRKTARSAISETLVVYGQLTPRAPLTVVQDAIDRYATSGVPNLTLLPTLVSDPNYHDFPGSATAFASLLQQLVVLDDIPAPTGSPLNWSPFTGDRGKRNHSLASWLTLPWGGPQLVVLPGFHTPAEKALKLERGSVQVPNGDDLFLSAMTLQACGANTILMSRWRSGGRASYDLVGAFLKNDQNMTAAAAWRKAVIDVGVNSLVLAEEPRVRSAAGDEPPMANHPFFWGAFLLIDSGEPAALDEETTDAHEPL